MSVRQYGNRATLPKTQKTLVWQIGDDADNDAGNKVDPRFIDNGDGIITDRATGLQWPANITEIIPGAPGVTPDNRINSWDGAWTPGTPYLKGACVEDLIGGGFYVCAVNHISGIVDLLTDLAAHPTYWRLTPFTSSALLGGAQTFADWASAIDFCRLLAYFNKQDWRMANVNEIMTIMQWCLAMPFFDPLYFTYTPGPYWSSDTDEGFPAAAYQFDFTVKTIWTANKVDTKYFIPVRGGK